MVTTKAPVYDDETHLSGLLSIKKTWERSGDVSKSEMAELEAAIQRRIRPNNHPHIGDDVPLSKLLDVRDRFIRKKQKHSFAFKPRDEDYLKRVKNMIKGRKNKDTRNLNLKTKLAQRRATITDDTDMKTLQAMKAELLKKKLRYPEDWREDEKQGLKKVKQAIAKIRRNATMSKLPRRIERDKEGKITKSIVRTGMTKKQEKLLTEVYYGDAENPPVPMGAGQLYDLLKRMQKDDDKLDIPSMSSIQKWLSLQKLQQVYAPRRLEARGDVSAFKPTAPITGGLSMDLANYQRRQHLKTSKDDPKDSKKAEKYLDKWGADGYVLVVLDNFSRYMWARALPNKNTQIVAVKLEEILDEVREKGEQLREKHEPGWAKKNPDKNVINFIHTDDGSEWKGATTELLKYGGTMGEFKKGDDTNDYIFTVRPTDAPLGDLDTFKTIGQFFGYDEKTIKNHNTNIKHFKALKPGTEVTVPESKYKPIRLFTSVGGRPQENALVERAIRTLKNIVSKTYSIRGNSWRTILPGAVEVYNEHHNRMTGMSPQDAIELPPDEQEELRMNVRERQKADRREDRTPLKEGDKVRLRIAPPTFNRGSKQSYYATEFTVDKVIKGKNPQHALKYKLKGGTKSAANKKLLDKAYAQRYLLRINKVEGADKLAKDELLKQG